MAKLFHKALVKTVNAAKGDIKYAPINILVDLLFQFHLSSNVRLLP